MDTNTIKKPLRAAERAEDDLALMLKRQKRLASRTGSSTSGSQIPGSSLPTSNPSEASNINLQHLAPHAVVVAPQGACPAPVPNVNAPSNQNTLL